MINKLYHLIPYQFTGNTLYPLNKLKDFDNILYQKQIQKYKGRTEFINTKIPYTGKTLIDYINLSPVPISQIYDGLIKACAENKAQHKLINLERIKEIKYFSINIDNLDTDKLFIIHIHKPIGDDLNRFLHCIKNSFYNWKDGCHLLTPSLPKIQYEYFKEAAAGKCKPYLFTGISHVLYDGPIDINNATIEHC